MAIIPHPELRKRFKQVREGIVPGVDILALVAAEAAWRDGDGWLADQLVYLRTNRDWLVQQVNALPELSMVAPEASYLGWIDASQLDVASPALYFENTVSVSRRAVISATIASCASTLAARTPPCSRRYRACRQRGAKPVRWQRSPPAATDET